MHKIYYYSNKFKSESKTYEEWLENRKYCFGGSDVYTLTGHNKHETFEELVQSRKNKIIQIDDKTEWGHWFENIARVFVEKRYGTIYDYSSIPHPYYPISYSPDGILLTEDKEDIMLLEIKNPIYRDLKDIPEHHIIQVQIGMSIFNVRSCILAQFRFRRCKLGTEPYNNEYDYEYHMESDRKCTNNPIAFGHIYWEEDCKLFDLSTTNDMIKHIKEPREYRFCINEKNTIIHKGLVLMWKLFEVNYTDVAPEKYYIETKGELLWNKYKEMNREINNISWRKSYT